MFTGYDLKDHVAEMLRYRVAVHLAKPANIKLLVNEVLRMLREP